jgi:branched-chain amino acid transport system permease protein
MQYLTGSYYIYCFFVLILLTFIMWKIVSSPFGLCLKAIRDNPEKRNIWESV